MNASSPHSNGRRTRAFTLVEIMTAVAITTIIVYTLVSMFNTSAKALRAANRQTDVWAAARATFGILEKDVGEVVAGGLTNRINLFTKNGPPLIIEGQELRLQDIYVLSRDDNQWTVNMFLLGPERQSDGLNNAVKMLYRYQKSYPVISEFGAPSLEIDYQDPFDPNHAYSKALDALTKYLDDKSKGIEPDGTVNALANGIVHLRLVAYAADGRPYTNTADLNPAPAGPLDHYIDPDTIIFRNEDLPASLDLEMFVLAPDRIEEFRAQSGDIARRLYIEKHVNSIEMFRTRIPIRRDLLARQ